MAVKKYKKTIDESIKRKGALTRRAKREGDTISEQAQKDKRSGTPLQKQQANYYLNVLRKGAATQRKVKKLRPSRLRNNA